MKSICIYSYLWFAAVVIPKNIYSQCDTSISVNFTVFNAACGDSTGIIIAKATGGTLYQYHWNTGANTDTLINIPAGLYSVTVSSNGCSATASDSVRSIPGPDSVFITSDTLAMCPGDSAYLCAIAYQENITSYHWNNGATSLCLYALNAGNYYVTVTDQNGCTAKSNPSFVMVFSNPTPSVSAVGDTLRASGGDIYQWYLDDTPISGATDSFYVATQSGQYAVEVTNSYGCQQIVQIPIPTVGIVSLTENTSVMVYPNPNSVGSFQLVVGNDLIGALIEVFDDNGRIVYQSEIKSPHSEISSQFAEGVYLLRITNGTTILTRKLVKL